MNATDKCAYPALCLLTSGPLCAWTRVVLVSNVKNIIVHRHVVHRIHHHIVHHHIDHHHIVHHHIDHRVVKDHDAVQPSVSYWEAYGAR